jgi:hypothetical protein
VKGERPLEDGDRIRIGNQEIVFSRVVAPRRPGRPTGSLRHCRKCQSPYMAEAPNCPNCGYGPGSEETLSGAAPAGNLDRETWSLQLQVELLEKALSLYRLADGDRVLGRIAVAVDERVSAGLPLEAEQLESAFRGAVRLASAQGEAQWIRWVLSTIQKLSWTPSAGVVEQIAQVPPIVLDAATEQIAETLENIAPRWDELDDAGRGALTVLREVHDRLRAQRQRAGIEGR